MRSRQRGSQPHDLQRFGSRNIDAFQQGVAHFRAGRLDQALSFLRLAVQANQRDRVALVNLARVQAILGQPLDAVTNFDRALALDPNFAEAHLSRGQALLQLGQLEEAKAACVTAAKLRPRDPQPLLFLGAALRKLERLPEALDALQRALKSTRITRVRWSTRERFSGKWGARRTR